MTTSSNTPSVGQKAAEKRTDYLLNSRGDAIGSNWKVPQSDFARFLGFRPPAPTETRGDVAPQGVRVLELALMQRMRQIGLGAAKNGNRYAAFYGADETFAEPGKWDETFREVRDAARVSVESHTMERQGLAMGAAATEQYLAQMQRLTVDAHADNTRYLEMQYKFEELGRQDTVMSNLMKARHDSITRSIRGG